MKKAYISDDGKIFNNEREYLKYEQEFNKKKFGAEANVVLKDYILLFGYDTQLGWFEVPYEKSNLACRAYVKRNPDEDEELKRDHVHELYRIFIPWELSRAIDYDEPGWYIEWDDEWKPWGELESELNCLKRVETSVVELKKLIDG
jgi:hypothetical protein